ncbi:MAG TPA: hypothetical protein VFI47_28635 [Acidimicrobiales bacterium]|nr:hypothetical protein [Acidimicrobiales bacterium]
MKHRLLPLAAALSVAGLAASGCTSQAAAVRVGDDTVSQSDLFEELDLIAGNDDFRAVTVGPDVDEASLRGDMAGSYAQEFVATVLGQRIVYLLADDVLADEGIEVTDDDRAAIVGEIDSLLPGGADSLPDGYREDFVEGLARLNKLQSELGTDGANTALREKATDTDIEVASQFGRWDDDMLTITPPEGPSPAPGGADAGASGGTGLG